MKKTKRIIAVFFMLILCSQSFAAIVSDNDGSAFTTKAEFDALKKSFQKQIDDYNSSIDGKIDGAIASYLSGLKLSTVGTNVSLVYKISSTGVKFVDDWKLPTTSKGVHRKAGAFLVFAKNAQPYIRKNAAKQAMNSDTAGWFNSQKQGTDGYWYDSSPGYEVIKMGLVVYNKDGSKVGSPYFDYLIVHEADVNDPTKVLKVNKYNSNPYVCENYLYDLCPISTVTATACGGSWSNISIPFNAQIATTYPDHVVTTPTADHGALGYYGQSTGTWKVTWHGLGVNAAAGTYSSDVTISGASSCEETRNAPSLINNVSTLSGGAVPNTKIHYVNNDDWGIPDTTAMSSDDDYTYVWQCACVTPTYTSGSFLLECYGDRANPQDKSYRDAATYGLPIIKTWNYKIENDLYYKDLVLYDASVATNNSVKYYTGVPLCVADDNYTIKVELNFDLSDTSTTGTFAIRKEAFNNSALESTDVTLYQSNTNIPYTDFSISNSSKIKNFDINAKKGETYWIKIAPSSGKQITVHTAESFNTVKAE